MNFRALLAFFTLYHGFGFVLAQQNPNQGAPAIDALFRQDGFPFSIQVWDNRSGLPQNSVNDVLFLPEKGIIALATNGGLVYFNGNRFEMDQKLEAIRPLWRITSLFKDPLNRLWALGEGRIGFCDSAGWHMIPSVFPPQNLIRFFPAGNPEGNPGLLTKEGCFVIDKSGTKAYSPVGSRKTLLDVKSNAAGETWFLFADALTSSSGQSYAFNAGAKAEVFPLSDGRVAVFNPDSIFIFTGKKRQKLYSPFTLGEISSVESWGEELLLATTNGLYHWKPGKDQARRWSESFLRTPLSRAQVDGSGLLWVASKTSGLALLSKKILFYPPDYEEFAFWSVNGVYYDPTAAKLFIGPDCGMISILDQDSKTILTSKSTCAYSFAPAGRNRLFVGTFGGGLQTMRYNGDSTLTVPSSLFPPRYVYSMISGPNATFFGTEDGLWTFQGGSYAKINPRLFPPNARVFVQKMDSRGRHWVGTDRASGFIEQGQFSAIQAGKALPNVRALWEDSYGTMWLGTYGEGLFGYRDGRLTAVAAKGLPRTVSSILPVNDTLICLSSNEGLFIINANHLDLYLDDPQTPVGFMALRNENGLKNKEFNGGFQNAGTVLPGGELIFPSIQGTVLLDPKNVYLKPRPLEIVVQSVRADDRTYPTEGQINLLDDFNLLEISVSTGFTEVAHQYVTEYALDKSQWLPLRDSKILLRGLRPGPHIIEIRSYHTLFPGLPQTKTLHFHIPVPFTQNPSFYIILFFVAVGFIVVFLHIRTRQISAKNERLQRLVDEKTADLETLVDELQDSQELLLQTNYTLGRIMSVLSHNVKGPLKYMTHIAEYLKNNAATTNPEELEQTLTSVVDSGNGMVTLMEDVLQWAKVQGTKVELNRTEIPLNRKIEEEILFQSAPAKQKQVEIIHETKESLTLNTDGNLLSLIIQNLLSNAIKFSHEGSHVSIKAEKSKGKILLSVSDTGVGIPEEELKNLFNPKRTGSRIGTGGEKGSGIGLLITKDLVSRIDGRIWAISREGQGTTFYVELPLK